jgi:hypothetical protein
MESADQMLQLPTSAEMAGGAAKIVKKALLLGRERNVFRDGRSFYVVMKGEKVPLSKAKEMDAAAKKAKKEAEAKKKAKAAAKAAKATKATGEKKPRAKKAKKSPKA